MSIKHYIRNIMAVSLMVSYPGVSVADVTGAGIGATSGSSTITSTTPQPDASSMSGTANIGNATSNDGVMSSTPPDRSGMVAPDKIGKPPQPASDDAQRRSDGNNNDR